MKVMCIKEPPFCREIDGASFDNPYKDIISIGEIYNVVDFATFNERNYYKLAEVLEHWFNTVLFAPLSDIDETEMVRDRELAGV